jgi:hypothetical protein
MTVIERRTALWRQFQEDPFVIVRRVRPLVPGWARPALDVYEAAVRRTSALVADRTGQVDMGDRILTMGAVTVAALVIGAIIFNALKARSERIAADIEGASWGE